MIQAVKIIAVRFAVVRGKRNTYNMAVTIVAECLDLL
jgi:hypothetical protein